MAGHGGASHGTDGLAPVPVPARGPSGRVALGLVAVVLIALVGFARLGQTGDGGPGSEAALGAPTDTARPVVTPAAPPSPTTPFAPPGTAPPRARVQVGLSPTCPPGSTPDEPGPADQARPPVSTTMAFDRRAGRLVALADAADGAQTWTFDVCTNTWTRMHPKREPPGLGDLVHDADSGVTVGVEWREGVASPVWAYDLDADTWTEKGDAPAGLGLRFYDPVSGLVVALGEDGGVGTGELELWSYEVETDVWTPIPQANRPAARLRAYAYDASVDRIVAYSAAGDGPAGGLTWLFDLRTGTWSGTAAVTPVFSYGWWGIGPVIAYDEAAERTVMAGQGRSVAYDAAADRWQILFDAPPEDEPDACGSRPECRMGRQLVFDAANGRLVAYGGSTFTGCTWEESDDMWAFDMTSRSWTLILPPTPRPPPLRDLAARRAPTGPDRSPWVRPEKVTLHGGPFFTRMPGLTDEPWSSTPHAAAATAADGLLLPECQLWTDGTVWWEETTTYPDARAWTEIDLGGAFVLDAAIVQADVNDEYLLSYRDPESAEWVRLWAVPFGEAGGMATRPDQRDASVRWPIDPPVTTDALRFEATGGDAQYSVSEIAVFGRPAP